MGEISTLCGESSDADLENLFSAQASSGRSLLELKIGVMASQEHRLREFAANCAKPTMRITVSPIPVANNRLPLLRIPPDFGFGTRAQLAGGQSGSEEASSSDAERN